MSSFFSLKVSDIVRETADAVAISFDVPELIQDKFSFLPGQYLTLKLQIGGAEIRRSYSICSSPLFQEKLTVAVKKVKDGKVSGYLNDHLKVGDSIELMTPMGNFCPAIPSTSNKNYVLFAGGSGITPMMSILKTVLKSSAGTVQLFYGNEQEDAIIFKSQLEKLQTQFANRFQVYSILNKPATPVDADFAGIMNEAKNELLLKKYVQTSTTNEYFICGPVPMMDAVVKTLEANKIDKAAIHVEYFTAPVSDAPADRTTFVESQLTVVCDGDEVNITLKPEQSVLEAALAAGLDAPYACQGGSCCTCRALLVEGKVHMNVNYALLESEVKEGFILTCQSHALTPNLVVDYDRGR